MHPRQQYSARQSITTLMTWMLPSPGVRCTHMNRNKCTQAYILPPWRIICLVCVDHWSHCTLLHQTVKSRWKKSQSLFWRFIVVVASLRYKIDGNRLCWEWLCFLSLRPHCFMYKIIIIVNAFFNLITAIINISTIGCIKWQCQNSSRARLEHYREFFLGVQATTLDRGRLTNVDSCLQQSSKIQPHNRQTQVFTSFEIQPNF